MSLFDEALVAGKLHVDGRPVTDWQWDRETGLVELFLASEWEDLKESGRDA